MSDFWNRPQTRVAQKEYVCIWCGEKINSGDLTTVQSGKFQGELQRNRYHPECFEALARMCKLDRYFGIDGFQPHCFTRGCICERGEKHCDHKWPRPTPAQPRYEGTIAD